MISAVVLAKDEEENIKDCLSGIKWCDEVLVIDDYSEDKTGEIARQLGAKVIKQRLNNDFAAQRNFALEQAKEEWVLFVDADERISEKLRDEIINEIGSPSNADGYYFKRIDYFLGNWLHHGEIGSVRILRLAKRNKGKWRRKVDEVWEVEGKLKTLKNSILHYSHPNLNQFLININQRSGLNALELFKDNKRNTPIDWLKPWGKFIYNFIFRLGFLDGIAGFVFAVLMSLHSFLVRGKLYLLWRKTRRQ